MQDNDAHKSAPKNWQSLLMASNQALLSNSMRMAQLGPDASLMILQWAQAAVLYQADFGARSLQLAMQLLAPKSGGNAPPDVLEATTRVTDLTTSYLRGLGELQKNIVSDMDALAARLQEQK